MKVETVTCSIRLSWWLRVYLNTLGILCNLTGLEPNHERVGFWINKGVRIEINTNQSPPQFNKLK